MFRTKDRLYFHKKVCGKKYFHGVAMPSEDTKKLFIREAERDKRLELHKKVYQKKEFCGVVMRSEITKGLFISETERN